MKSWREYIKGELNKDPGILLLAYPYTFLWGRASENKVRKVWHKQNLMGEKIVYIHIPFCERKCYFCNFTAYFNQSYDLIRRYVRCLKKEMKLVSSFTHHLRTNYFSIGGGTPSILHEKELGDILKTARNFMNFRKDAVMSIELFPDGSTNGSKLKLLKDYGINRISLGIQTFDNKIKRACNRFDSARENIQIYNKARKTGFSNINFDLMFGLPNQTLDSWRKTLNLTVKLAPDHLCICPFTARNPKIPLYNYMQKKDVKEMIQTFDFTRDFLSKRGYSQVSRHSYVKKETPDIYNDFFSMFTPALGLGLNSVSYNSNFTYKNTADLMEYVSCLNNNKLPVEKSCVLQGKYKIGNYIARRIGHLMIDRNDFREHFGRDVIYYFRGVIQNLAEFRLIDIDKDYIKLTSRGLFYEALVKRCFYGFNILRNKSSFYKNISLSKSLLK